MSMPGRTIMVVDGTPPRRSVLTEALHRGGFTVVEAPTGADALDRFTLGGIDLLVIAVELPDTNGFEICERVKADGSAGTTPVVLVSSDSLPADRLRGMTGGADAYLVAPIDRDELLGTVTSILRYARARIIAELLATRLTNLARLSTAMHAEPGRRTLLEEAVRGGSEIFRSPIAVVVEETEVGRLMATSAGPGREILIRPAAADPWIAPLGVAFHDEPGERWPAIPTAPGEDIRVLTVRGRLDAPALTVAVPASATIDGAPVLSLFAQAVQSAVEGLRHFDAEHDLALTLQHSLLPRRLPTVAGFDLAVRYVPASDHAEIGGDFYEVVHLDDQVFVAVGDVGGHSLHAATIMAELRHATRAYLAEGHGPAAAVDRLNALMLRLIPGEIATLCLLAVDTVTGRVRLCNAGHPSPVLAAPDGVRLITDHGPLLGIDLGDAAETEFTLAPGATVVLYTDGLIERRTRTLDSGFDRIAAACAHIEPDLEDFASRLLEEVGPSTADDDIAMVAIRRHGTGAFDSELPNEAVMERIFEYGTPLTDGATPPPDGAGREITLDALVGLRRLAATACDDAGLPRENREDFVLAVNELLTNVLKHGGGAGRMWLWSDAGWLYCKVTDDGPGVSGPLERAGAVRPDQAALTGRGFWLIRRLIGRMRIRSGPSGTAVTIAVPLP
ncbi:MAG: SpoIIE family protein phosphatase [Hamadaea sp.]|nr:SpoIIE family protein phosphatase [Hamadaea sp.]